MLKVQSAPSLKETYRVGVIGCGMRAISFFKNMPCGFAGRVKLGAVYDPAPEYARHYLSKCGMGEDVPFVDSIKAVLATDDLDALIIGSPNDTHTAIAIQAFARQLPILLEKPVAVSPEECRELWTSWNEAGRPPVRVGFVLRDTPFFKALQEGMRYDALGQLLSIDSDELVGDMTTAFFWKGWRLDPHRSGGFLLEKCCHDFDYLRVLSRGEAVRVYAVSRKSHLTPKTPVEKRHRRLDEAGRKHLVMDGKNAEGLPDGFFYDTETVTDDHYAVTIEWDNDVLTNFTCCLAQGRPARRVRLYGSAGAITGDMHDGTLIYDKPKADHSGPETKVVTIKAEGNHHGGDRSINEMFWSMVAGQCHDSGAGIRDGIEAALLALAAQQSLKTKAPVDVTSLRRFVFGDDLPSL